MTLPTAHVESRPDAHRPGGDDALLVRRLEARDETAVELLITRYGDRLFPLALRLTGSHQDAEEVLRDVFWRIVQKIDSLRADSRLSTWVYRLAVDAALARRRARQSGVQASLDDRLPTFPVNCRRSGDAKGLLADWSQRPEAGLLSAETRAIVSRAIDGLPEPCRAALILRDIEELSNEEAAAVLGESLAAVKSGVHRARMALREQLARALG